MHIYLLVGVDMTLFRCIFIVVRLEVGVVTLPGWYSVFLPVVSRMQHIQAPKHTLFVVSGLCNWF